MQQNGHHPLAGLVAEGRSKLRHVLQGAACVLFPFKLHRLDCSRLGGDSLFDGMISLQAQCLDDPPSRNDLPFLNIQGP